MTWTGEPPLTPEFAALDDLLDRVLATSPAQFSEADAHAAVTEVYRLGHRLEAAKLHLLRVAAATVAHPGSITDLLTTRLHLDRGQAKRDITAARLSDPDAVWDGGIGGQRDDTGVLRRTGHLLASGEVSRAHLDHAVRVVTGIPTQLRRGEMTLLVRDEDGTERETTVPRTDLIDGLIADKARLHAPRHLSSITDALLDTLDPDRSDRDVDPDAFARRGLRWLRAHGMWRMTVDLDDVAAAVLKQAIAAYSAPDPHCPHATAVEATQAGPTGAGHDDRSSEQREHDGLVAVVENGIRASDQNVRETGTVLVSIELPVAARPDSGGGAHPDGLIDPIVDGLGPAQPAVFDYLACDARIGVLVRDAGTGALRASHETRYATTAQRRALTLRDQGCVAPGCTAPAWACHAHHVRHWQYGGPTSMENLLLLCPTHHRALHAGHLEVRLHGGRAEARWTTSGRRPGRRPPGPWCHNALPADRRAARRLGITLRESYSQPGRRHEDDVGPPWSDTG